MILCVLCVGLFRIQNCENGGKDRENASRSSPQSIDMFVLRAYLRLRLCGTVKITNYSSAGAATTGFVALNRRRKKKAKCLALHWRQRNGRRSRRSRTVRSSTPRRCERKISSLPHKGHCRVPTQSEIACVLAMIFNISRVDNTPVLRDLKRIIAVMCGLSYSRRASSGVMFVAIPRRYVVGLMADRKSYWSAKAGIANPLLTSPELYYKLDTELTGRTRGK